VSGDFLQDPALLDFVGRISPTHFYLSGGEPLIHPGIKEFIPLAGRFGHKISIDTNLHVSKKRLEDYLSCWDPEWLGFINISHHLVCNISMEIIESRFRMLEEAGIGHFVKYVGVPEHLPVIERNMKYLKDRGTGAAVSILQGKWKGKTYPAEYTPDETVRLLNLVTLKTHGLQVFDGIQSRGIPCRGGQDFIAYNMHDDRKVIPCCHGSLFPLNIEKTFFRTGDHSKVRCPVDTCLGDLMFICGINGITDEIERFEGICSGGFEFFGVDSVMNFVSDITSRGYRLTNHNKYEEIRKYVEGLTDIQTLGNGLKTKRLRGKSGEEMLTELEKFVSAWETPEDVIRDNPSLEGELRAELSRLPSMDARTSARALGKKVAQSFFGLPQKCNFEVISTCILKCEFCTLHDDLKEHRRKLRMTYDEFMKIWKYMEVFTTEVEFTGGEPLLNKDVFAMIRETAKSGVYSTLTTNAQLLDEKACASILEAQPSRILIAYDSVGADNYEAARVRGKFERLRNNIVSMTERKRDMALQRPDINIQMVVSKKNKDEVALFWKEAVEMKVDSASIKPLLVWPGSGREFEKKMIDEYLIPGHPLSYHQIDSNGELVKARKPGFCSNTATVHIGSGSEVVPCWYILKDTYVAGYAADRPFLEIWFSDEYEEYRHRMKHDTVSDACRGCIGKYEPGLFITKRISELTGEVRAAASPDSLNREAELKYQQGDKEGARSILLDIVKHWPEHSEALNNLGVISLEDGDVQGAVTCFKRSREIDPNGRDATYNYINVLAAFNEVDKAREIYSDYVKRNKEDIEISRVIADIGMPDHIEMGSERSGSVVIPVVSVMNMHRQLDLAEPIDYPVMSLSRPLNEWKMETDDSPIFRYIYRNIRPRRHLEFGTWQGTGVLYCLEECDATVWTINLLHGEDKPNGDAGYGISPSEIASARDWAEKIGFPGKDSYRTDSIGFIGRHYLQSGMEHRVCQIYCDSRKWDISHYPAGFFDTVLIDGGHAEDIVISDTRKAFELLRSGGIIMWHDFCPPLAKQNIVVDGVINGICNEWQIISSQTSHIFWIYPSWILLGIKK